MTTIVHAPSCPTLTTGGASGPCLCIPQREDAPRFVPRQGTSQGSPRAGEAARRRKAEVNAAVAGLNSVGRRWRDAREWAIEQERSSARALSVSSIDPVTVEAYLVYLAAEAAEG